MWSIATKYTQVEPYLFMLGVRVALALIAVTVVLRAAEPWTNRDSSQWTPQDIERLLTNSPWSQQTNASFKSAADDPPEAIPFPVPAPAGMAGQHGAADGKWDGGVGRNPKGGLPSLPVMVRWDSSLPVREALSRSQSEHSSKYTAAQAEKDYVITVIGLVRGGAYRHTGQLDGKSQSDPADDSDGRDPQDPEEMLEGLMSTSKLVLRSKPAIAPEDVKLDAATGAIHLFFPRTEPIISSDREVTFTTRFGSMKVTKSFRLKNMVYKGKLEL